MYIIEIGNTYTTIVFLIIRLPTKVLLGKSPYEHLFSTTVDYSLCAHLIVSVSHTWDPTRRTSSTPSHYLVCLWATMILTRAIVFSRYPLLLHWTRFESLYNFLKNAMKKCIFDIKLLNRHHPQEIATTRTVRTVASLTTRLKILENSMTGCW